MMRRHSAEPWPQPPKSVLTVGPTVIAHPWRISRLDGSPHLYDNVSPQRQRQP
jgi:hypothetical protein